MAVCNCYPSFVTAILVSVTLCVGSVAVCDYYTSFCDCSVTAILVSVDEPPTVSLRVAIASAGTACYTEKR